MARGQHGDAWSLPRVMALAGAVWSGACSVTGASSGTTAAAGAAGGGEGGAQVTGGSTGKGGNTGTVESGGSAGASGASGGPATGGSNNKGGAGPSAGGATAGAGGATPTGGAGGVGGASDPAGKPRIAIVTDIGFDPDDEESMVRFLVYADQFDVEGLIAGTSTYVQTAPHEDLIRAKIDGYATVLPNLLKHAAGYPSAEALRVVTATGQPGFGMASVGSGKSSAGSNLLVQAADKADARPLWVALWGGANTLAQALQDVAASRSAAALAQFVAKLRVYAISDQDDAGVWLRQHFPDLFYIVSPSPHGSSDYAKATWSGISGDKWYSNGPLYQFDLVDNPWLLANVIQNHGALGALYPQFKYIMEGDTPSWLGLIDNGLGWSVSPSYGGWGGRYVFAQPAGETHAVWTNDDAASRDSFPFPAGKTTTSDQATIWRWRDHYQDDFAARMSWCVATAFNKANHNPTPVLNGSSGTSIVTIAARAGSTVTLDATGTGDPDGDAVSVTWWIYSEAGTLAAPATLTATTGTSTAVSLPAVSLAGTVHVILQAEDNGTPHLFAYRRAVLNVTP
jgi:cellulose-binding protein